MIIYLPTHCTWGKMVAGCKDVSQPKPSHDAEKPQRRVQLAGAPKTTSLQINSCNEQAIYNYSCISYATNS